MKVTNNQFDSYPSIRVRCEKEIIVQFVSNTSAALKSSFAKGPLISFSVSLYFRVMSKLSVDCNIRFLLKIKSQNKVEKIFIIPSEFFFLIEIIKALYYYISFFMYFETFVS